MNELSEKQVCDVLTEMYGVNTSGLVRIEYIKLTGLELKGIVNACIKKYSASPNANTVLCGVADIEDLKCCGNCMNSRHYMFYGMPESMFCCAVSAHRIKPHNMCGYWKQDNYESEQRNIDKPKP